MAEESVILQIDVDADKAQEALENVSAQIVNLRAQQKQLKQDLKDGNITAGEYAKQMEKNKDELKQLTASEKAYAQQLNAANGVTKESGTSIREQAAALDRLKEEYRSLSQEQRKSDVGKQMLKQIGEMDAAVKSAEGSIGNFQRNVGNYKSALDGVNFSSGNFLTITQQLGTAMQQNNGAVGLLKDGCSVLSKQLLVLATNPIVAVAAAIVVTIKAIVDGIKRNEEALEALRRAMSVFNPILDAGKRLFEGIGMAVAKLAEYLANGLSKALSGVLKLFDKLAGTNYAEQWEQAADAARELTKAEQDYAKKKRQYAVDIAKIDKEVAELRAKVAEKDKYTQEERIAFLDKAIALETAKNKKQVELAKQAYDIAVQNSERAANDAETLDQLSQANVAYINAQAQLANETRRLKSERASLIASNKEVVESEKEVAEATVETTDAYKDARERYKLLLDAAEKNTQAYFDLKRQSLENEREMELANIKLTEEEKAAVREKYNRLLADIDIAQATERARLENMAIETTLSEKMNEYKQAIITAKEWAEAQLDAAREKRANLTQDQFETLEEYKQAVLQADAEIIDQTNAVQDAQVAQTQSVLSSTSEILGALSDAIMEFAGENEKAAKFAKALALFQIGIDTAKAISGGVAEAMSVPFPGNLAAIATTIATVTANIIQAKNIISQLGNSPKFADGGIVGGSSYSGDNVLARVNSGEMVITKEQQASLFDSLNGGSLGGFDYDRLAACLQQALESMPAPVLVYEQFEAFQRFAVNYKQIYKI